MVCGEACARLQCSNIGNETNLPSMKEWWRARKELCGVLQELHVVDERDGASARTGPAEAHKVLI